MPLPADFWTCLAKELPVNVSKVQLGVERVSTDNNLFGYGLSLHCANGNAGDPINTWLTTQFAGLSL